MKWNVVLERKTKNRLNLDNTKKILNSIMAVASRNTALGFAAKLGQIEEPTASIDEKTQENFYEYVVKGTIKKENPRSEESAKRNYEKIFRLMAKKASNRQWTLRDPDNEVKPLEDEVYEPRTPFIVPELNEEVLATHFKGIYERESQIRVIHDSAKAFINSLKLHQEDSSVPVSRSHLILKGKPAGCKTTLFERFKEWYEEGSDEERITIVDMTSATKAGLENWLLDKSRAGTLAEIIVLEEIEKRVDKENLLVLVSLMGSGYVSKLNARIGLQRSLANVLVWATCNDENIIRRFNDGVLWSRFVKKMHCPRPSKEIMAKILAERVSQIGGNVDYISKALQYTYEMQPKFLSEIAKGNKTIMDEYLFDDPREVLGLLDGRERLLDGSYQADLLNMLKKEIQEKYQ